ncbi:MAG: hypothetical protein V3S14_05550 [Anaerolineae bacterium]
MRSLQSRTTESPVCHVGYDQEALDGLVENHRKGSISHLRRPLAFGLLGSFGMMAFYLGLVTLLESWTHALDLFREDAPLVVPFIMGFGIQVGLFTYLKLGLHMTNGTRTAGAVTGTAGGTSTLAMVACCAHHVTDVLPLLGLSGAAIFLSQYKIPFMVVGLLSNVIGIGVMLTMIWKAKRRTHYRRLAPGHYQARSETGPGAAVGRVE